MWIQSLVSCPTHKNTTSLFHQYRYQQQETSPSFISEAPTHLSKGFWTRCGNLAESLLKDPRRYYGKGHSSFERAACSKQQPFGVCSARSCSLRQYFRRAYEKLWTFIVWAQSCYRAELLFQASCYIIKQERKKKKKKHKLPFWHRHYRVLKLPAYCIRFPLQGQFAAAEYPNHWLLSPANLLHTQKAVSRAGHCLFLPEEPLAGLD